MGNCHSKTLGIEATSRQQPTSPITAAHTPSSGQSLRRSLQNGGIPQSEESREEVSAQSPQPTERNEALRPSPPRVRVLPSVTSSSSGFRSSTRTMSAGIPGLSAAPYHKRRRLTPSVRRLLREDFKFRILVIGKSRSGKSSLIKAIFKVDVTAAPGQVLEETDINFEYRTEANRYVIAHECCGLESRDSQNFLNIRDFISRHTDTSQLASERLHAIWICIPTSDVIDGNLGEGVEEILSMRTVPVILVFTKFDIVVSEVHSDPARGDAQHHERTVSDAHAMYEESVRHLFHKDPRDVPAEVVSEMPEYVGLIEKLVVTTNRVIRDSCGLLAGSDVREGKKSQISAVHIAWSAALRVGHGIVIDASIEVGGCRYWHHLWSNVYFADHSLQSCVNVIHVDLVEIWNLNDKTKYLSSEEFKVKMSHFVKDLVGSASMTSDPYPTGAEVGFADWVRHEYKGSEENVRCIMGYIVDLTVIFDAIFTTISDDITPENVVWVLNRHVSSGKKDKIHHDIRTFVAFAIGSPLPQKDWILERIGDLIRESCPAGYS